MRPGLDGVFPDRCRFTVAVDSSLSVETKSRICVLHGSDRRCSNAFGMRCDFGGSLGALATVASISGRFIKAVCVR